MCCEETASTMLTPEQINGEAEVQIISVYMGVIFEKPNGFAVCEYRAINKYDLHPDLISLDDDAKLLFTAHGVDLPKNSSQKVLLVGHWQTSATSGRVSFRLSHSRKAPFVSLQDIQEYIRAYKCGVPEDAANSILAAYGKQSVHMIKKHPEEVIALFKGARRSCIEDLRSHIIQDDIVDEITGLLGRAGIQTAYAPILYKKLGSRAVSLVLDDPYILSSVLDIPFSEVDRFALASGMPPDHDKRIDGALYYLIGQLKKEKGHICFNESELTQHVIDLLNKDAEQLVSEIRIKAILDTDTEHKKLVRYSGWLYTAEDYMTERSLAMLIANLASQPEDDELADKIERAITRWQDKNPEIRLNNHQKEAVMMLSRSIGIITGGPGTGKTTALRAIIEIYHEVLPDAHITLMAPTGRAASRMREAIGPLGATASTIHKGLDIIPYEDFIKTQRRLPPGLVVTDEYSMISQALALAQVASIEVEKEYCFLMVGDVHQLPSIEPGDVLNQFIKCKQIPCVKLDTIYRQGKRSSIPRNCKSIVEGVHSMILDDSFWFHDIQFNKRETLESEVLAALLAKYEACVRQHGDGQTVVLSPFRRYGLLATRQLNPLLRGFHDSGGQKDNDNTYHADSLEFHIGDKVVQTNRSNGPVSNGDLGYIRDISPPGDKNRTVTIDFGHAVAVYGYDDMKDLELGYALSIHKSQGCQYDCVIVPMVMGHKRMLNNKLLLTAVSRAAKEVHLIGEKAAFRFAVSTAPPSRGTLLAEMITHYIGINYDEGRSNDERKPTPDRTCRQLTLFEHIS